MFLKLRCYDCDNVECQLCPLHSWIDEESLEGCTREVSENFYARYEHEIQEVLPFQSLGQTVDYSIIDNIQAQLYSKRIGTMLDEKGKATGRKKKIIDKLNMDTVPVEE